MRLRGILLQRQLDNASFLPVEPPWWKPGQVLDVAWMHCELDGKQIFLGPSSGFDDQAKRVAQDRRLGNWPLAIQRLHLVPAVG